MDKVVHFGAGNIGRGFIGALFAQSGYHVTFIDIAEPIIDALNEKGAYKVRTASENQEVFDIRNVSGINNKTHPEEVVEAIKQATYITTAIGPKVLPFIAPLIAQGLTERLKVSDAKVYVIACENQINATDLLKKEVLKALDSGTLDKLEGRVYFFNSAVDRIVPLQHNEELLDVLVESYHEWIVETTEKVPAVKGMQTVSELAPYIERKLFTVNTGHAVTAYLGYLAGKKKIHEALLDKTIYGQVKAAIEETGAYLIKRYAFDPDVHEKYIEKILYRFQNPKLNDDVTRVGRSPIRKLGPEDRLVKPAKEAEKLGLPFEHLAGAIAACLQFDANTDSEAVELQKELRDQGLFWVLREVSHLSETDAVTKAVVRLYKQNR
ncbi:mannitol-1-phosphate 5-dehydrogenase [Sporolactobacillus putidus]|uniref:Mannitol-1-phosphate 5-dehydrogenase n=1 Tax=Sporolactobacillus putidus TaxID=492735 RepID=A0A917W373_9BACL|nr:mannitol-1-phosphate 5-dehydrogenase [Sporolactobacillus putidus]GGL58382.1 mannitol-1-phosphate 5-dehydrogenase [Sporolactobacillus putidus]